MIPTYTYSKHLFKGSTRERYCKRIIKNLKKYFLQRFIFTKNYPKDCIIGCTHDRQKKLGKQKKFSFKDDFHLNDSEDRNNDSTQERY